MPVLQARRRRSSNLPSEDVALADVVQVVVKDFKGDLMAFFRHLNRPTTSEDTRHDLKLESAAVKRFVKRL